MTSRLELKEFKQKLEMERVEHAIKRIQAMRGIEEKALAKVRQLRADLRLKAQKESAE